MRKISLVTMGAVLALGGCSEDNGLWLQKGDAATTPDASTPADTGAPTDATTDVPIVLPTDLTAIAPDDVNILYSGRFDTGQYLATDTTFASMGSPKKPTAALSGSSATIAFTGTAIGAVLQGSVPDYYDGIVDGKVVTTIKLINSAAPYPIAANLTDAPHVVSIVKRTESNFGRTQFLGFVIAGQISPPPTRPARRILVIGDSITAGFGMDAASAADPLCMADGQGQPTEDAYNTFGALVARDLLAESQVVGVSGIGLMRNYQNTYDPRTMPEEFDLLFPEPYAQPPGLNSPVWDPTHALWVPDAILIALGTNDFGSGNAASVPPLPDVPSAETFGAAYIAFATTLRGYYPNVHIFAMTSPAQPDARLDGGIKMMVAAFPDQKVHEIQIPQMNDTGCTGHPSVIQHAMMAAIAEPVVKTALGW
ncbi:MAG TPA: SGNH/GDSL hydrolase family protein [Polyangia bacterium]|jgi:lysophospholipase L1-like esterase